LGAAVYPFSIAAGDLLPWNWKASQQQSSAAAA
jgi:hypothetical protein